jgi:hypothetical protein
MDYEYMIDKFYKKSEKAHKVASLCYSNKDYIGCIKAWLEEGYFNALAPALYYDGFSPPEDTVALLRTYLDIGNDRSSQAFRALEKLNKLGKKQHIADAINKFISEVSDDFILLTKKSIEIYHTLQNMRPMEMIKNGLDDRGAEDRLFMQDASASAIFNRRKSVNSVNKLMKNILEILETTS